MAETTPARIEPRLQLLRISKAYPSVVANAEVNLTVMPGEIHAVLGENGAGKSTLMKIIYGVTRPDRGQILWEGHQVEIASPSAARQLGIGMVFQHFSLFETLTVAENISLALDGNAAPAALAPRIRSVSAAYGLPVDPDRLVHSMSVGERQRVEIVRCLLQSPRLLIMDEPTSVLTPQAVLKLFDSLRRLAAEGCSILYISHKLDEIQSLCDRATVLRAGRVTGTAIPREQTARSLAELMIGRELPACRLLARQPGEVRLALLGMSVATTEPFGTDLKDLHLQVRGGEIVGIAGISGNGQQELLRALSGESRTNKPGSLQLLGRDVGRLGAAERRALGLGFVPEERLGRGAVPDLSLTANALLTGYGTGMVNHGLIRFNRVRDFARQVIDRFEVKCGGERSAAGSLSGGNLQKFIVGRETLLQPQVLVVAQPTWGVDIGASMLIRQALIDLRDQGVAVLVLSEELDELFMMCDRLAVLANGRLSPAIATGRTNIDQIGAWMSGNFETQPDAGCGALAQV
jgi:simple sugar transport system ATP-binding protein